MTARGPGRGGRFHGPGRPLLRRLLRPRVAAWLHVFYGLLNVGWGLRLLALGREAADLPLSDVATVVAAVHMLQGAVFLGVGAAVLRGWRWSRTFLRLLWLPQFLGFPVGTVVALYVVLTLEHADDPAEEELEPGVLAARGAGSAAGAPPSPRTPSGEGVEGPSPLFAQRPPG